ncbi:SdrD B-like domain-containing protein [uncultured Thiothrix sp.]|mgnify:CR=1 FL=1|uniref:SdrD B-like domain-containing protein n=1 Tax=uncultured Thiothrix sp. TaxID=223185 RepID=UPI00262B6375|nr:SdrD B-like domain-containing protein [uncultured Thiothrix sp.]
MKRKLAVRAIYGARFLVLAPLFLNILLILGFSPEVYAAGNTAVPVVNTTISVAKTGSEPFDSTTWDGSLATAGLDANEDNSVTRLQDSITYLVEVSVNDKDVPSLTSTVQLDKRQAWIEIPTGCKTDPKEVNPVSSISTDKRTLFCNLGPAVEGTTRAIYPVARALAASYDGSQITLNDQHVSATVSSQAQGSNVATAGPTDVTVTANFRVDTTKELQVTALDPTTGKPLYIAPAAKGADGTTDGSVVEYVIKVKYQKGSMLADAPNEAGGDFEQDYSLLDHYTDDNNNNSKTVTASSGVPISVSTGAVLYTWDPKKPACELVGDHGPNASVTCTQVNHILDQLGPNLTPDGINDPNIAIDLKNIDVRDPNNDSNLIELRINIWYSNPEDIANHQNCSPGPCTVQTVNSVGVYDATAGAGSSPTVLGFNPVSTEDASHNNLLNYNGQGEPFPDYVTYPLIYITPGGWTAAKGFDGPWPPSKTGEKKYAPGAIIPILLNIWDYRFIDGARSQLCEKLDTDQFEYVGLAEPNRMDLGYAWNHTEYNPNIVSWGPEVNTYSADKLGLITYLYSDDPHSGLLAQRDETCEDDVNSDGKFVLDGVNQTSHLPDAPNDWVTDPALIGGVAKVSKLRMQTVLNKNFLLSLDPTTTRMAFITNHLLKIKPSAKGYTNSTTGVTYLPNYMAIRNDGSMGTWGSWKDMSYISIDPDNVGFSYAGYDADRVVLAPSSIALEKYTEPRGLKVVRGGDRVQFTLKPEVFGSWNPSITTASLTDSLPVGTDYVLGSERFSVDGGTTWLTHADYLASTPNVSLSSAENTNPRSIQWNFADLNTGDQLPLIRYSVDVNPKLTTGTFINNATLYSDINPDGADADTASDPVAASYQLNILANLGLDVFKAVDHPIHGRNEPFEFELVYTNLGGEDYSSGDFIDILPYNNDGNGQNSSGLASTRYPSSKFNGIYAVSKITASHSEVFYATNAASNTIQQDPCHESNQAVGKVPAAGDLCYLMYVNNGNKYAGGSATGTGTTTWTACTSQSPLSCGALPPESITGLRFTTPALTGASGGKSVLVQLSPTGNIGGTPDLDVNGKVTAASTGDIYTNNFGGRVPELSLQVIANDVSVTIAPSTIGDRVWLDSNGNGLQDATETGIAGVQVKLQCGSNSVTTTTLADLASTPENEAGLYQFSGLAGGNAASVLVPSASCTLSIDPNQSALLNQLLTSTNAGGDSSNDRLTDLKDNDASLTSGLASITFTADSTGKDNQGFDFGFKPSLSLGNYVWYDQDMDGVQDANEAGIGQVGVALYDNATCTGAEIASTTTTQTGWYEFNNLANASYCLKFTTPNNWTLSPADKTSDTLDSDAVVTGTVNQFVITDINLNATDHSYDVGLFHTQCTAPIVPIGSQAVMPAYGSSPWHHPSAHNVEVGDLNLAGFCLEKQDEDPAVDDLFKVNASDRQSLSATRIDYLKRLFSALGDPEVLASIQAEFGAATQSIDTVLQNLVWYYTNWNEDFTKYETAIDDTAWTTSQKAAMKALGQLILEKTQGSNGQTQYSITEVYWLQNQTDTTRQDLIVPSNYVFPDEQCTLPKLVDVQLTKTLSASTAKRGETLTYELSATNQGPSTATQIKITDQLPSGVRVKAGVAPLAQQGSYDPVTGIWDVGNLSTGQTVKLVITVTVD